MNLADVGATSMLLLVVVLAAVLLPRTQGTARRLGLSLVCSVGGVTLLVGALVAAVPNDAASALLGEDAPEQLRRAVGRDLGVLDDDGRPVGAMTTIGRFVRGSGAAVVLLVATPATSTEARTQLAAALPDEPRSLRTRETVRDIVASRAPRTARLALGALVVGVALGVPPGVIAAHRRRRVSAGLARLLLSLMTATPRFFVAAVLLWLVAVRARALPAGGDDDGLRSLVLPALTLGIGLAASIGRLVATSLLDVLASDFIRNARAVGVPAAAVLLRHALPVALLPVIHLVGAQMGGLLAGAVIVEKIFAWPGLGTLLVEAIRRGDFPIVQGVVVAAAVATTGAAYGAGLLASWLDPRARHEGRR